VVRAKLKDPFNIPLEDLSTMTLEEQEELLKRAFELSKQAIMRAFSENPGVVEVVVCDGQVVYMARELGEIDMELLDELMSRYGKPCYVFGRPEMVEGAFRSALVYAAFVRRWSESPLTLINPEREGLVGRKLMLDLALELRLNPILHKTFMRLL